MEMKVIGILLFGIVCLENVCVSSGLFEGLIEKGERLLARRYRKRILRDLRDIAEYDEDLEVFVDLLLQGPVVRTLVQQQPITILAPVEDAFENVSLAPFAYYYNSDILRELLLYHIVPGTIDSESIVNNENVEGVNLYGDTLSFKSEETVLSVETASGMSAEIVDIDFELAGSSVLHVIDSILTPPDFPSSSLSQVAHNLGLTELLNALEIADVNEHLETFSKRGITVFAPTNDAFMQLALTMNVTLNGEEFYTSRLAENIPEKEFESLLLNHFVAGVLYTEDLKLKAQDSCGKWGIPMWLCSLYKDVRTLAFESIRFSSNDNVLNVLYGQSFQHSATVLSSDVRALNGVAHVVDSVIT